MEFIWEYPQVYTYEYLHRYSYANPSTGFLIILTKQEECQNLTQIVPFIDP